MSTIIGDPFFTGLAALALGVVAYLASLSFQEYRLRWRQQRGRNRRQVTGYD